MNKNPSLADVRARRAEIATIIEPLQAEDKELADAESALVRLFGVQESDERSSEPQPQTLTFRRRLTPPPTPTLPNPANPPSPSDDEKPQIITVEDAARSRMTGKETIEDLILLMLDCCEDPWWTASELQLLATRLKGRDVPMSSVSPTLSTLKNKKLIVRDGLKVALPQNVKNNEAASE